MAENFINHEGLTYCGKEAEEIFVKNLFKSDLKGYGIRYMGGVKGKQKLMTGEVGDMFQEYSCPFTPSGEVTLSESYIEPVALKVNLENCYDEFWQTYLVEQTEISLNGGIPQDFYDWFFNNMLLQELSKEYEDIFWNGDATSGSGYLALADGVVAKAAADSNVKTVAKVALTTANILAKVGEVAMAIDDLDNDTEGYKVFMNYKDFRKLVTALGANSPKGDDIWSNFAKDGNKVYAYGYEVVPCRIAKDTILASHPMNLVLGYDVADSEVSYKIIDMRETTLDNVFRTAVITNIAVGIVYPSTIVLTK